MSPCPTCGLNRHPVDRDTTSVTWFCATCRVWAVEEWTA